METENEVLPETPDINFSEDFVEQETPDIDFTEINTAETPDIDFGEDFVAGDNQSREQSAIDDEDIDDLDEPDQYVEHEDDTADDTNQESSINPEETATSNKGKTGPKSKDTIESRLVQLPTARVKHIMKADPDVTLITSECTFLVSKATELFIESLAREAFLHTSQAKKKTVQKRDVDAAIENVESLMFLEGMMNF